MSGRNDQWFDNNIDRWEIISNVRDWVDNNAMREYSGGYEDHLYDQYDRLTSVKMRPWIHSKDKTN